MKILAYTMIMVLIISLLIEPVGTGLGILTAVVMIGMLYFGSEILHL